MMQINDDAQGDIVSFVAQIIAAIILLILFLFFILPALIKAVPK